MDKPGISQRGSSRWRCSAAVALIAGAALGGDGIDAISLISITRSGSDVAVAFEAVQGATYRLERKAQIGDATWQSIPGLNDLMAGPSGPAQIIDSGTLNLDRAFYRVSYVPTLTVTRSGTGSGTVTSSPAGIDCGTDCAENYLSGTDVSLAATANAGSTLSSWGGDCAGSSDCSVTMDAPKSVSADFTLLDSNPSCMTNQFLGTVSGDTSGSPLTTSAVGEKWFRVRVMENNNSLGAVYLSAKVTLTSPAGTDYDLHVYCGSCGGSVFSSTTTGTDVVDVRRNDSPGADDSFDVMIEVRYFNGDSPGQWNLSVAGNVVSNTVTCL